jgi:hypothetical protein
VSKLRPTRWFAAALAVVLVLLVAGSDFVFAGFWINHPMLTAIVSALVVVVLSVAVIEVVLSRRAERRWRLLAQSALIELGEAAYNTWSVIAKDMALEGASELLPAQVHDALVSADTGPKIRGQVEHALAERSLRERLASHLSERRTDGRQILARWAVVLTSSETYAEVFDQHVELYGRVDGLERFIHVGHRQSDPRGRRTRPIREYLARGGEAEDEWFVDNLITTVTIGANLEDATWNLALRVVPEAWWDRRTRELAAATRTRLPIRPASER